jgi:hypothetical protein
MWIDVRRWVFVMKCVGQEIPLDEINDMEHHIRSAAVHSSKQSAGRAS